jgi:CheY-like chemotaxis protein
MEGRILKDFVTKAMARACQQSSILIVEDEILLALDAAMTLEDAGHAICGIAQDRAEALRLAQEHEPDLALVDVNLADGETGLRLTRQLARRHGIPCILTTAYSDPLQQGSHAACARLAKPFTPSLLCEAVAFCTTRREGGCPQQGSPHGLELLL